MLSRSLRVAVKSERSYEMELKEQGIMSSGYKVWGSIQRGQLTSAYGIKFEKFRAETAFMILAHDMNVGRQTSG